MNTKMRDASFAVDLKGLARACELLSERPKASDVSCLPLSLPINGIGERDTLEVLAPLVLGGAARLDGAHTFAHMDPPTPWITWAAQLWNSALNQNLLHPATAPVAREIEQRVIAWLAPFFGMDGGHMVPGSTLANLTGLWAARECAGVRGVYAGEGAHISVAKAAHLLGLRYRVLPSGPAGEICPQALPSDLGQSALVLTAGTTSAGVIDPLDLAGQAAWTHVDAAWAGPLRISERYGYMLDGVEAADSIAISAHKWLFQPKESALILFRDTQKSHSAVSFSSAYLATANVGLLGSHGANAVALLATLLAWGRAGMANRIETCMALAEDFAAAVDAHPALALFLAPKTGIVLWRPKDLSRLESVFARLPAGSTSRTCLGGSPWFRNVAANPNADRETIVAGLEAIVD